MPIRLPLDVDTKDADKKLKGWKTQIEKALGVEVKLSADDAKLMAGLGQARAAVGVFNEALNVTKGVIESYPDLFGETGKSIAGAVPQLTEAATQATEWATQGALLGSVFPGIGTAAGAAAGFMASAAVSTLDWLYASEDVKQSQAEILEIERQRRKEEKANAEYWKKQADVVAAYDAMYGDGAVANAIADLGTELDKTPPKVVKVKESFTDWLDTTYDKAKTARDVIHDLNKEVIASMENDGVTSFFDRMRDLPPTASAHNFSHERNNPDPTPQALVPTEDQEAYQKALAEYEAYAGTMTNITEKLTGTLEKNIATNNKLFAGMGRAAASGVSNMLKQLGHMWFVNSIAELATAFAVRRNKLMIPIVGPASDHFIAAAQYGAAAVAAGVGGAVLGGLLQRGEGGSSGSGESGGAGGGTVSQPNAPQFSDPGPKEMAPIVVYMGGGPGSTTIHAGNTQRTKQEAARVIDDIMSSRRARR